jgi:hypothetical protein
MGGLAWQNIIARRMMTLAQLDCHSPDSTCTQLSEPAVRPITLLCPSYPVARLAGMAILLAGPVNPPRPIWTAFRRFFFAVFP